MNVVRLVIIVVLKLRIPLLLIMSRCAAYILDFSSPQGIFWPKSGTLKHFSSHYITGTAQYIII